MFGTTQTQKLVTIFAAFIMSITVAAAIAVSQSTSPNRTISSFVGVAGAQETGGEIVALSGTSHCAKCSFGLRPMNATGELGYALRTDSGTIAVVEDVHQQYTSIYRDRFSSHRATVTGTVLRRSNNVVWIQPSSLVVIK